jgi:fructan beta-fructosidase
MKKIIPFLMFVFICTSCNFKSSEILIADFEDNAFGEWKPEGTAFGDAPTIVNESNKNFISGNKGNGLLYSTGIDTGVIKSPILKVQRRYLAFLLSCRDVPDRLGVEIISDGKKLLSTTGKNSRGLDWYYFDLKKYRGKEIQIQVVDKSSSNRGGSIMADHFILTNVLPVVEMTKKFRIEKQYINLPVRTGDKKKHMQLIIGDTIFDEFDIELADSLPEFYAFVDVSDFIGQEARLTVNSIDRKSKAFDFISVNDDTIIGSHNLYNEPLRQQIHFSTRRGWINDPNGLVYYDGEYHLFYQHNPYGWGHGNMHWGHAISSDLVHWEEVSIALYPYQYNDWAFSGSAIIDTANTAGFKTGDVDVMIAAYTSTGRGEALAFSNDRGRTFTDYVGNPVVKHRGRDPKIIWYAPGNCWVMAVYHEEDEKRWIAFYKSENLKEWAYQSKIEGYFECPEIFELSVDNDPFQTKWVLYAADGAYSIGTFNGKIFIPDGEKHKFNYGNCFYASQTFNNIPESDGRRIQIGWGRTATPNMPFNQCMLFPVELTLKSVKNDIIMFAEPVKEVENLHGEKWEWNNTSVEPEDNLFKDLTGELFHIIGELAVDGESTFEFMVHGTVIRYDSRENTLSCLDNQIKLMPQNGKIYLEILVDRNTVEIFCNHGLFYMPIVRDISKPYGIGFYNKGGLVKINSLKVFELKSIWNKK